MRMLSGVWIFVFLQLPCLDPAKSHHALHSSITMPLSSQAIYLQCPTRLMEMKNLVARNVTYNRPCVYKDLLIIYI
jgi:hypothetical protein